MLKKISLSFLLAVTAFGYDPQILREVHHRVQKAVRKGEHPVLIFDLDDTLIDTRHRQYRILNELAGLRDIVGRYPAESNRLRGATPLDMAYNVELTFQHLGIGSIPFIKEATTFWGARFFTNTYCARDREVKGGAEYVRRVAQSGAEIIYLTGREKASMEEGTLESLKRNGFPIGGKVRLLMKPDKMIPDHVFKQGAFQFIRKLGLIVAVFENEPKNINLMAAAFPGTVSVFLDTAHSPNAAKVTPAARWVKNFEY